MLEQLKLLPSPVEIRLATCTKCGRKIVAYERTAEGNASEFRNAAGECFDCDTWSQASRQRRKLVGLE